MKYPIALARMTWMRRIRMVAMRRIWRYACGTMSVRVGWVFKRRWKVAILLSGLFISLIGLFVLMPVTFVQQEYRSSFVSYRMGPYTVVRSGYSRFSEKWFEDGPGYGGSVYRGRCFIDYIENGRVMRRYGWKFRVRTYFTQAPHRVTKVEISIE